MLNTYHILFLNKLLQNISLSAEKEFFKLEKSIHVSLFIFFFLISSNSGLKAASLITHYSVDNGLSENHVMSMLQEDNGLLWFGTYDGLNKFDGYTFKSYRGNSYHKYKLLDPRVNVLARDKNGFIWLITNDRHAYRFDPSKDEFTPFPQSVAEFSKYKSEIFRIITFDDGSVWLLNYDAKTLVEGFRIKQTDGNSDLQVQYFSEKNKTLPYGKIFKIFVDKSLNTWLLCKDKTGIIYHDKSDPVWLDMGNLISIIDDNSEIFLGSKTGALYKTNNNKNFRPLFQTEDKNKILSIEILKDQNLFLMSDTNIFHIYNLKTGKSEKFISNELKNCIIYGCYKDKSGRIWIDSNLEKKQIFFDTDKKIFKTLNIETNAYINTSGIKFQVFESLQNEIWIQTRKYGFFRYNSTTEQLEILPTTFPYEQSPSQVVHTVIFDKQGCIWLATYLQGIDKVIFEDSPFQFYLPENQTGFTAKNEIRSVFQDSQGYIWAGSKDGWLYIYDNKQNLIGYMGKDGVLNKGLPFNYGIFQIYEDKKGNIWLSTKGNGLYRLKRNNAPLSFKAERFVHDPANQFSLSSNDIYGVYEDHYQRIWIASYGGGLNILDETEGKMKFINSTNLLKNYPEKEGAKIRCITADKNGHILIGSTQGLIVAGLNFTLYEAMKFKRYYHQPENPSSLSGNDVHAILQNSRGEIFISTIGGGINIFRGSFSESSQAVFEVLKTPEMNTLKSVYTFTEVPNGKIWMSGQTNIICYNPEKKGYDVYKPFSTSKYFFSEAAACVTRTGDILYGTSNGIVRFNPEKTKKSDFVPYLYFTDFLLFNKSVMPGAEGSPLKLNPEYSPKITLTHKQNTFSIEYAALDHSNPANIHYAYKLEGLESDWNYVGNQRTASYINLPKGKYIFHVRSTNSDGVWVNNERTIVIIKKPSFWESAWAYLFYIFLFILVSFIVTYVLLIIYRLRDEVIIEQRISNAKLRFFTDISHELRTPLTLIISPLEKILSDVKVTGNIREQLDIINKNANRMLRLINQILDFRKIQNEKMKLIVEKTDIVTLTSEICSNFSKVAEEKNIRLNVINQCTEPVLWVDKDKFEKILFNLLSNAFKFSTDNGKVDVILLEDIEKIILTVNDQGSGIPKDRIKNLFVRFESFTSKNIVQGGTGIGLSLTKELVEMHKATIEVESEPGKGTSFSIYFKKGKEHFDNNTEFILNDSEITEETPEDHILIPREADKNPDSTERYTILIAEDNNELRTYLMKTLGENYITLEAKNGNEALEMANKYIPDLIISDISMPGIDGIELAGKIKTDLNTCHIPFIMLTAKSDIETKLQALEFNIDDYITKPFSFSYLEARIENLLKIREQLQTYYKSNFTTGTIAISKPEVNNQDEKFINKIIDFAEENYIDSDLNIDDLAESSGLSRSSFFKKMKSLTGMAPVDFIKEFRLQKAVLLIEAGEKNIAQLAYNVGFQDAKYFSKCFRNKFGMTPSEYRKKGKTEM